MRVFLDTNVLVAAFASRGLCADLLEVVLLEHDLVVGRAVLRELGAALRRKVKLPAARSAEIVDFVSSQAIEIVEAAEPVDAGVDADDALVLGEGIAGRADVFVTGDAALVKLATVREMPMVTPRQFWQRLRSSEV
ncbi:putative toxin-antitoxin system toxin component, PIN family [Candidatus Binatia bacterium]|nr:putative toxin-antitoxin system toxin component, PIN family [Candidatus Binatia bacterium]